MLPASAAAATERPIAVVGAGLAGLNTARLLGRAGLRVIVFDAADAVGGRVRTDVTSQGFRLDRGFQVLFTAYPALRRAVDVDALDLRMFDNGAAIVTPSGPEFFRPPLQHPEHTLSAVVSPLLTWGDRRRLVQLGASVWASPWDGVRDARLGRRSTAQDLEDWGFSERVIEAFFRPLFGGVFLETGLATSAEQFRFVLKMLVQGRAALPAGGMQALPEALRGALAHDRTEVRLNTRVMALENGEHGSQRVRLADGASVDVRAVIVATDGAAARALLDVPATPPTLGCTTVYLAGRERPYRQRLIGLSKLPTPYVHHAALLTNVAPEYAPPGWHLLSATLLGSPPETDDEVDRRVRADLARWFPRADFAAWETLAVVRVPRALMAQPPGFSGALPGPRTALPGVYAAGEWTQDSSINGALRSGEEAARAVAADLGMALSVELA